MSRYQGPIEDNNFDHFMAYRKHAKPAPRYYLFGGDRGVDLSVAHVTGKEGEQAYGFVKIADETLDGELWKFFKGYNIPHFPYALNIHSVVYHDEINFGLKVDAFNEKLLAKLQSHGPFSEELALKYFRQLILTIYFYAQKNIFHPALCIQNLYIDANDDLKVNGYGLENIPACHLASVGRYNNDVPEALNTQYDRLKASVFRSGVILFHMLAGREPFSTFETIANCQYKMSQKIQDGDIQDLLQKIFVSDPEKRITIAEILKHKAFLKNTTMEEMLVGTQDWFFKEKKNRVITLSEAFTKSKNLKKIGEMLRPISLILNFLGMPNNENGVFDKFTTYTSAYNTLLRLQTILSKKPLQTQNLANRSALFSLQSSTSSASAAAADARVPH